MKMSTQRPQNLQEYLQRPDVQERIQQSILQARSNVTVTISKAAELFDFTESRLREWEKKRLLTTDRSTLDGKEGHRKYTTNELSKLAVLQELFNHGGYAPSDIPTDYNEIWERVEHERQNYTPTSHDSSITPPAPTSLTKDTMYIDHRIEHAEQEVFWRYFTSQVLRLSLMLICEDMPDSMAGLILPLEENATFVSNPKELSTNGKAFIGWLSPNGSFNTFLTSAPEFEHPSDFRIEPLLATGEENFSTDKTMIVVQRKAKPLNLSLALAQTLRRLLEQIYAAVPQWYPAYDYGLRDYLYQATDFTNSVNPSDDALNKLMDMIIQLGGSSSKLSKPNRWKFCCLLLPQDSSVPVQRRSLVVRAQSTNSPYKLGIGLNAVYTKVPGLSLRAYQSGNIIYEPDILVREATLAYHEQEKSTRSAIALPIIREDGLSIATLYIASDEYQAFPIEDQRVLRLIGTMIQELLLTYAARQQTAGKKTELIDQPEIVDPAFEGFLTENDFIRDLEALLITIADAKEQTFAPERDVSFIAVDIDNQSIFSMRYGDRVARNLSHEVGSRLQEYLKLFAKLNNKLLYHLNADRYYLLLDGMSLDDTRRNAEQIRIALKDNYLVDAQRFSSKGTKLPVNMLEIPELTVRLGVTSYTYVKFKEILQRYSPETSVVETRALVMGSLDTTLSTARREGGNNIVSWNLETWSYATWSPPESELNNG